MTPKNADERAVLGWREWVTLPDLGVSLIKAKIDTGARTSSLHAFELESFRKNGRDWVGFTIHPEQRSSKRGRYVEVPVEDWRKVRSSSGKAELRPVVLTMLEIFGERWEVELTLTRRDAMGFRMLLGRQAIRGRLLVDPGRSYLNGKRSKKTGRLLPRGEKKKKSSGPRRSKPR